MVASGRSPRVFTRRKQCAQLARIFRRLADEEHGDKLRAARYSDLSRWYEAEAKRGAVAET